MIPKISIWFSSFSSWTDVLECICWWPSLENHKIGNHYCCWARYSCMTVNKYVQALFSSCVNPFSWLFEKIFDGELQGIFKGQDFMIGHQNGKVDSWIKREILSAKQDNTALILFYLRISGLRVLTISPRNNPPIPSEGEMMQLMF